MSLFEKLKALADELSPEDRAELAQMKDDDLIRAYFGIGMYIRNTILLSTDDNYAAYVDELKAQGYMDKEFTLQFWDRDDLSLPCVEWLRDIVQTSSQEV